MMGGMCARTTSRRYSDDTPAQEDFDATTIYFAPRPKQPSLCLPRKLRVFRREGYLPFQ